jgi:hypothetical protein
MLGQDEGIHLAREPFWCDYALPVLHKYGMLEFEWDQNHEQLAQEHRLLLASDQVACPLPFHAQIVVQLVRER